MTMRRAARPTDHTPHRWSSEARPWAASVATRGVSSAALASLAFRAKRVSRLAAEICSPPNECRSASPSRAWYAYAVAALALQTRSLDGAALCLWCDVLVYVEEVVGIVGPFELNQAVVVLAVVVLNSVVVVVLHKVDVAARLGVRGQGVVVVA